MPKPIRNYYLPDASVVYTHRDGRVFMYDRELMENRRIGRPIAARIIQAARRHPDPVNRSPVHPNAAGY